MPLFHPVKLDKRFLHLKATKYFTKLLIIWDCNDRVKKCIFASKVSKSFHNYSKVALALCFNVIDRINNIKHIHSIVIVFIKDQ